MQNARSTFANPERKKLSHEKLLSIVVVALTYVATQNWNQLQLSNETKFN